VAALAFAIATFEFHAGAATEGRPYSTFNVYVCLLHCPQTETFYDLPQILKASIGPEARGIGFAPADVTSQRMLALMLVRRARLLHQFIQPATHVKGSRWPPTC